MTANDLIAAFETLADAPDGVKRLRELVLQLAVRGKLVAQHSAEESPNLALQRIERARARLVKTGELRKPKPLPPVDVAEAPADIPSTWVWARLDQLPLFPLTDGDWVESKDQDPGGPVRLTQLADVGVNEFRDRSDRFMNVATAQRLNCTYLQTGDVLIARLPSPIGRACIFPGLPQPAVTVVDVAVARFNDEVNPQYVVHALNSSLVRDQVEAYGKGATRFRVATGHLRQVYLPVPPLAEQHRIVARVEELMGLLDRLDAARTTRDEVRRAARDAALAALRDAEDTDAVEAAWGRIAREMDTLFTYPEDVGPLRQAVLDLGVSGRLVPCDVRWVLLADLLREPLSNGRSVPDGGGYPVLRLTALRGSVVDTSHRKLGAWNADDGRRFRIEAGDLLVVRGNGSKDLVARACMVETTEDVAFPDTAIRLRPNLDVLSHRYLFYAWEAPSTRTRLEQRAKTTAGIWKVSQADLYGVKLPVAPLDQQHRIVAKVDTLMSLCDALEARLAAARDIQAQFAAAAVHHLDVQGDISS